MYKNLISSLLILIPFFIIAVATSKSDYSNTPIIRSYNITSNCGNATLVTGTITASDSTIISPPDTTYLSLGLPLEKLIVGEENSISGEVAPALTRTCAYSIVTTGSIVNSIYSCLDNMIPSCIVTLTPLQ